MHDHNFSFKIDGEGVKPETVSVKDLFEILINLENAMAVVARETNKAQVDDDLTISIVGVSEGSNKLACATSSKMDRARNRIEKAVANDDLASLPQAAQRSVYNLWRKARDADWKFEFIDGEGNAVATLSSKTKIDRLGAITGRTVLYGKIERVGGDPKSTAQIVLLSGDRITVQLASTDLAVKLGERLFEVVGLEGEAKWDEDDWKLKEFKADGLSEYEDIDVASAFRRLSEAAGDHWESIDPDEFVRELRAD